MVTFAGREHSRNATPRRVQGRQNLLPRGTLGGVRQRTTRTLAAGTTGGAMRNADQTRKADQFRALHIPGKPLVLFNIWDPGGAKVVAASGAKAVATSSWSVANANGFADGERIPLSLAIENLRRIVGGGRRDHRLGNRRGSNWLQPGRQFSGEWKTPQDNRSGRSSPARSTEGRRIGHPILHQCSDRRVFPGTARSA